MGNLIWKCIPPSPSPPSFSPLHPQICAPSCSLFVGSIEKGIENKCYSLLKYLGDIKILCTRLVYCLRGFMAVAGGFLEGDFEQHLKVSWQIISANSKSAGWLQFSVWGQISSRSQHPTVPFSEAEQMPKLSETFRIPVLPLETGYKLILQEKNTDYH